jgi:hypothetical protein
LIKVYAGTVVGGLVGKRHGYCDENRVGCNR